MLRIITCNHDDVAACIPLYLVALRDNIIAIRQKTSTGTQDLMKHDKCNGWIDVISDDVLYSGLTNVS